MQTASIKRGMEWVLEGLALGNYIARISLNVQDMYIILWYM